MKNIFLIIAILVSGIANSQMSKKDFETKFPKVKVITLKSNKLKMGYQDVYNHKSNLIAIKVNGIYVDYENYKWFIPYNRIQSIDPKKERGLLICLKV